MGVITVAISFLMLSGKKIGLFSRDALKESISAHSVGGIASLTKFILKGILIFELLGAIVMMPFFFKRIWLEWGMDVDISFYICFLQCRF